jgi:hypothetical protein
LLVLLSAVKSRAYNSISNEARAWVSNSWCTAIHSLNAYIYVKFMYKWVKKIYTSSENENQMRLIHRG